MRVWWAFHHHGQRLQQRHCCLKHMPCGFAPFLSHSAAGNLPTQQQAKLDKRIWQGGHFWCVKMICELLKAVVAKQCTPGTTHCSMRVRWVFKWLGCWLGCFCTLNIWCVLITCIWHVCCVCFVTTKTRHDEHQFTDVLLHQFFRRIESTAFDTVTTSDAFGINLWCSFAFLCTGLCEADYGGA